MQKPLLKLVYYRKMKRLRQFDLAKALGLKEQTISAYETGRLKPNIETVKAIAKILGIDVKKLFPNIQETIKK